MGAAAGDGVWDDGGCGRGFGVGVELRCCGADVGFPGVHEGFAVFGDLVQEFVAAGLVAVEEVDEVFDGWGVFFAFFAGWFAHFEHVCEEALEVPEGVAEVDGLVDVADHGRVGVDAVADCGCEVVWVSLAEDADDFLSVSNREGQGEVFEGFSVLLLGEVGGLRR